MIKLILIFCFVLNTYAIEEGKFLGSKIVENLPSWFKNSFLDLAEDVDEAKEYNKYLILYFHQDGCPYCAKLIEDNFMDPVLVKKLRQNFEVIEINIWGDKELTDINGIQFSEKQYAEFLKVQFTPSLFFLDTKGNIILRMDGYQTTEKMQKILDFISNKNYQTTDFSTFIASKNLIGKLNFQPFFTKPPFNLIRNKKHLANKFLAVFFEEPDCKECNNFHQNMLGNNNIQKMFKQMEVVQLRANSNQKIIIPSGEKTTSKKWYQKLRLNHKPAIVFFDKNGVEIIRKDASFKQFHFVSILDYVLSEQYKTQSNFQRFIEHRADKIRATGKDVNIWK